MKPTVQQLNGDTLFCFTLPQSKVIAKRIQGSVYCDSLIWEQDSLVTLLGQQNMVKDSINASLSTMILNLEQINQNQGTSIELLETTIQAKDKKLKKGKVHKILLGVGLGIMTILAIGT